MSDLYDRDFLLWTQEQAAALRRAEAAHVNLPLDWENLAEEIESLGKSLRRELASQIRRVLRHLYKLEASPSSDPRAGWHSSIRDARADIEYVLAESPSLRREVGNLIAKQARIAAELAADDLAQHGETSDAVWSRLSAGGFSSEQVLGDWFPEATAPGLHHPS